MEDRVTPGAFYGSAIAALIGLAMGLMLHGSWQNHSAGPQLLLGSAAATQLARPAGDNDAQAAPVSAPQQTADLGASYVDPDPLPVTRLDPDRFDVKPAAEDVVRADVDDQTADAESAPAARDLD